MFRLTSAIVVGWIVGCQAQQPSTVPIQQTVEQSKLINWEQYQQLPVEEKLDPYVLQNLHDEVKRKIAEKNRQAN